ncbi:MAG: IS5 family transposase [Gammaproteobacteria bacterium]|nr:IS5 family transposase [Gammaproteobacteria bacterium]
MSWKNLAQTSLSDALVKHHEALEKLDGIHQLIDWKAIEKLMAGIHAKKQGEQAWPPLMMFKALLLQSWYGLNDPGLEKQLARDLLFRRFVNLGLSEGVPDHSMVWRFRNTLTHQGLLDTLLLEVNRQLSAKGLYIKAAEVSIVDATVIEAKQSRPRKGKGGENTQDREAGYNVKVAANGKKASTYSYKAHVNVDEDGFIKAVDYTPGNEHDSQSLEKLLTGTEEQVYTDKAYASTGHDKLLAKRNTGNRILHKAKRNQPLSGPQKYQTRHWASIRSTVERVFGVLKQHYCLAKARYLGLKRNQARFMLAAMAYNIKRGVTVQAEMMAFAG